MTRRRLRLCRASPGRRQPRPQVVPGAVAFQAYGDPAESRSYRCRRRHGPRLGRDLAAARCRSAPSGRAGRDAWDRDRLRLAHRFSAVVGDPEFLLDRVVAASGPVGRVVADAGRGADPAVAAQARHRSDDRELRRRNGDRPRHRGIPVYDLSQSALVGDIGRPRHAPVDVFTVVARSVSHPPPAGARLQARLPRGAGRIFHRMAGGSLARLLRRRVPVEICPLRRHRGVGFHQLRIHGIGRGHDRSSEGAAA